MVIYTNNYPVVITICSNRNTDDIINFFSAEWYFKFSLEDVSRVITTKMEYQSLAQGLTLYHQLYRIILC